MIASDVPLEVRCDACGQRYMIDPDHLRAFVTERTYN
jgi:hypothetical protein